MGWGPRVLSNTSSGSSSGAVDLDDLVLSEYDEVTTVPAATPTIIITYLVPTISSPNPTAIELTHVEFGGSNIGKYHLLINNIVKAQYLTWFNGSGLGGVWDFRGMDSGLKMTAGDIIKVRIEHFRPFTGDFFARLNLLRVERPIV